MRRGQEVLARLELIRISDRILAGAGRLLPLELRMLDAIHLATAQEVGSDLARIITYDERLQAPRQRQDAVLPRQSPATAAHS